VHFWDDRKGGEDIIKSHVLPCKTNVTYITRKLFEGGIEWSIFRSIVALDIHMTGRISETKSVHTTNVFTRCSYSNLFQMLFFSYRCYFKSSTLIIKNLITEL
jgi:hypothetical protein